MPEVFTNQASCTVATNGYSGGAATAGTPASGTAETWTMAGSYGSFPQASSTLVPATWFRMYDQAAPSETIYVSNTSTATFSVIRGAEGTTPVAHAAGATFVQDITGGTLGQFKQATGAQVTAVNLNTSTTETVVGSYQPVTGEVVAGTTFEVNASGSITTTTSAPTLTWTLRWGGLSGTAVLSMVTGTKCPALVASIASGSSFDVNATLTFISATTAVATLTFMWQNTTITYSGVASSATPVTVSGSGPLVLTAKWGTSNASNALVIPASVIYRAA